MTSTFPTPANRLQAHLLGQLPPSTSFARLESLYSDYSPNQTLNPPGFASNVSFWSGLIRSLLANGLQSAIVEDGRSETGRGKGKGKGKENGLAITEDGKEGATPDLLILHADDALLSSLRLPRLGAPYGLSVALSSLTSSRQRPPPLVRRQLFLASPKSIYDSKGWTEWIWGGVKGGLGWGLGMLGVNGAEVEGEEAAELRWREVKGDWVCIPLVERAADALWEIISARASLSSADRLYSRASLRTEVLDPGDPLGTGTKLSDADLDVVLKYLQRDRRRATFEGEVIKFAPPPGISQDALMEITPTDRGIVEVRETARQLELQVAELELQITSRTDKARSYLAASPPNKTLAGTHLRIRVSLTSLLSKRASSLLTLQRVLDSISQASSDAELARVYTVSEKTLTSLVKSTEGVEKVERAREVLEDAIAHQREIEEAVQGVNLATTEERESMEEEVQAELRELIAAEEKSKTKERKQEERDKAEATSAELEEKLRKLKTPMAGDMGAASGGDEWERLPAQ